MLLVLQEIEQGIDSTTFGREVRPLFVEEVISDDSQRPDITLLVVLVSAKDLRSHRHRRADVAFQPTIREILGEAEVGQLQLIIGADEDIRRLKISVGDLLLAEFGLLRVHFRYGLEDAPDESLAVELRDLPHLLHVLLQVPLGAVLQDYVPSSTHAEVVDIPQNVLVLQYLHQLDFFLRQSPILSDLNLT